MPSKKNNKCWYWSRSLFCMARPPQQLQGNVPDFPSAIILQKILFWSAIRSQIIFQSHFVFSLLLPPNAHCPGSEFTRWPTRLNDAGVCVLRSAFNLLWMKFLDNKSFVEKDTFQCHLLQSLKITSYSAPFLNSKWKNRVLPQHNLERDQLF